MEVAIRGNEHVSMTMRMAPERLYIALRILPLAITDAGLGVQAELAAVVEPRYRNVGEENVLDCRFEL